MEREHVAPWPFRAATPEASAVVGVAHLTLPVILMTAFGDETTRMQAEGLGAVLFDKPFDLDDLRTAVANLLPHAGSAR